MVVVVGAGATGLGVAWDLSLRGIAVTVVERGDLGAGTSGRFHGLLHSGGRYAVRDPKAAAECIQENRVLRRIAVGSIEEVGGYFVETDASDGSYTAPWLAAMSEVGIDAAEVTISGLRQIIPELSPDCRRAFKVPDGVINGFSLLLRLRQGIEALGGEVLLHTAVEAVDIGPTGAVRGVRLESRSGSFGLACDALVNAAGPWASQLAEQFGDPLSMRLGRGVMLVFAERMVPQVVNRLAPPGDGDILVPHDRISIWGTTDEPTDSAEAGAVTLAESRRLLALGADLFPQMAQWRSLRAFAGVRPLYQDRDANPAESRHVSRDFTVIDHSVRSGPLGVVSIVGGKWATFRLMAERTADQIVKYLGLKVASSTETTVLPSLNQKPVDRAQGPATALCECEDVSAADLAQWPGASLAELRIRTWFAMGPCQGTFCVHRVVGSCWGQSDSPAELDRLTTAEAGLRAERERGVTAALWGANAREWALSRAVRHQVLAEPESC